MEYLDIYDKLSAYQINEITISENISGNMKINANILNEINDLSNYTLTFPYYDKEWKIQKITPDEDNTYIKIDFIGV
jgi:hypothetical protein